MGNVTSWKMLNPAVAGVVVVLVIQLCAAVAIIATVKAEGKADRDETQRWRQRIERTVINLDNDVDSVTERVARLEGDSP